MSFIKFKWNAWSKYFKISKKMEESSNVSNDYRSFKVFCLLCKPTVAELSVSTKSSWNLKRHILKTHSGLNSEILDYVSKYKGSDDESSSSSSVKRKNTEESCSQPKQQKIDSSFKKVSQN